LFRESTPLAVSVSDPHDARFAAGTMPGSRPAKYVKLRAMLGISESSVAVLGPEQQAQQ